MFFSKPQSACSIISPLGIRQEFLTARKELLP